MFRASKQHATGTYHRKQAWHKSTKCIEQKSLTHHELERHRRYDGTHVNIASVVNSFRLRRKTEHGRNNDK